MPRVRCPICSKQFDSDQSIALPFCSERCRRIDLGRWLGEGYSVPIERRDEDPDGEYGEEDSPS